MDATERAKEQPLARMLVNLHNIEAGRQALLQHMRLQCKCHGVSGSCAMRSCYKKMPSFREVRRGARVTVVIGVEVGDALKWRFDMASSVRLRRWAGGARAALAQPSTRREPAVAHLVYTSESPDYCNATVSTRGRR